MGIGTTSGVNVCALAVWTGCGVRSAGRCSATIPTTDGGVPAHASSVFAGVVWLPGDVARVTARRGSDDWRVRFVSNGAGYGLRKGQHPLRCAGIV